MVEYLAISAYTSAIMAILMAEKSGEITHLKKGERWGTALLLVALSPIVFLGFFLRDTYKFFKGQRK